MSDKERIVTRLRDLLNHIAPSDEATATVEDAVRYIEMLEIANRSLMWMIANPPKPDAPTPPP